MRASILFHFLSISSVFADCDYNYDNLREHYLSFYNQAIGYDMTKFNEEWQKVRQDFIDFEKKSDDSCWNSDRGRKFLHVLHMFTKKLDFMKTFDMNEKNGE